MHTHARTSRSLAFLIAIAALALLAGCAADPAADAPAAEVQAPAPEPPTTPAPSATTAVYSLSEDSTIGFVGSKVTGSHEGGFNNFDGEITITDGTVEGSKVGVVIDTTSLWADNDQLTGHLKSADFFDVEQYPRATFTTTSIVADPAGGEDAYIVTGNLDLHGVSKQISFPATIELDDDGLSAEAEFSIKRFDFNIEYKGKADDLIRDDVLIKLDLSSASEEAA